MSTSATSKGTTPAAQPAPPKVWQLFIDSIGPLGVPNGTDLSIDASMPGPDQSTVIRGNMNDSSQTPFAGFYDSEGFIQYGFRIELREYNFYGVISPSGMRMSGYVTFRGGGDGQADDDASWSAQARGGGDDDDRPHRKPAAKNGHK